ncbi:DNA polymerase alpha subunit B [Bombina bombina]|uniref:DNA polymerase alpha subunit B n=1 Tax=Bombina bombina TaxID=8345 RepID=UPI00235AE51A|nr:DNA polymerase alpha subunit B [Bombina bombina]
MPISAKSIAEELEVFDVKFEDEDAAEKMVELCALHRLSEIDLVHEWMAFSTNRCLPLTVGNLHLLEHEVLNKKAAKSRQTFKKEKHCGNRDFNTIQELIEVETEEENLLDSYTTPAKGSQKRLLSTPENPQSKRIQSITRSPHVLFSPSSFSPSVVLSVLWCAYMDTLKSPPKIILECDHWVKRVIVLTIPSSPVFRYDFPGKVVVMEGTNSTGRRFVATKLYEGIALPFYQPTEEFQECQQQMILTACGPFTTSDTITYDALKDLVDIINRDRPDVCILFGPFLDAKQEQIENLQLTVTFDDVFKHCLKMIIEGTRLFFFSSHLTIKRWRSNPRSHDSTRRTGTIKQRRSNPRSHDSTRSTGTIKQRRSNPRSHNSTRCTGTIKQRRNNPRSHDSTRSTGTIKQRRSNPRSHNSTRCTGTIKQRRSNPRSHDSSRCTGRIKQRRSNPRSHDSSRCTGRIKQRRSNPKSHDSTRCTGTIKQRRSNPKSHDSTRSTGTIKQRRSNPRSHNSTRCTGTIKQRRNNPRSHDSTRSTGTIKQRRNNPRSHDSTRSTGTIKQRRSNPRSAHHIGLWLQLAEIYFIYNNMDGVYCHLCSIDNGCGGVRRPVYANLQLLSFARSYYPLYPPNEEINLDYEALYHYAHMPVTPDVFIAPSELRYFIKVSSSQPCAVGTAKCDSQ